MTIIEIKLVQQPGGAAIALNKGSLWDGAGYATGYVATAPEIDRLIAELCKARDAARAANRPKHRFGQTY